jgi:hypothetical protein
MYERKQIRKRSRAASIDFISTLPGGTREFVSNR